MNAAHPTAPPATPDLTRLAEVQLNTRYQRMLDLARASCHGAPEWRGRRIAEAGELLAHSQVTGRYDVEWLDLGVELRAVFVMHAPLPCLPDPAGPLRVVPAARIGFVYPEHCTRWPAAGTSFAQILAPNHVWLPNAFPVSQVLCLGTALPVGIRAIEVVHLIFQTLTLQSVQMDFLDASGVAHGESALWWQRNQDKLPLTHDGFVRTREVRP